MDIIIKKRDSLLSLLYYESNGGLAEPDDITYWKIDKYYLEVKSYNNFNIHFKIIDDNNNISSTYKIYNILYTIDNIILYNIKNQIEIFHISEYEIEIKVINKIPIHIMNDEIEKKIKLYKKNKNHLLRGEKIKEILKKKKT